jgi:coenzyme F420-0:L-glutamate ligase/coenzyme F420-1:gamma-L-glutamate ligase
VTKHPLMAIPIQAPVQSDSFNLTETVLAAIQAAQEHLQDGDIVAISSKYAAISQGRVVDLDAIQVSDEAQSVADRYVMNPQLTQLVMQEADHVFGGITHDFNGVQVGFLLTHKDGIISPNAGLDRSNIPNGKVVLFPQSPYRLAEQIRQEIQAQAGVKIGLIFTDSWLMPGRIGTTGIALATAGFSPVRDERGKADLFGNPMQVTQIGVADSICTCAQMVMGETAEATPIAIVRNTDVELLDDAHIDVEDIAIDWRQCIYVGSLSGGRL